MNSRYHVAIIGGGIAGLSTAWYLQQEAAAVGLDLRYTLLEQRGRWGGSILTERVAGPGHGFVVEGGPDSFIAQKPWALQLVRELGLTGRLLGTNDHKRVVYVLNHGRPTPLPDGVLLIVPTRFMPFVLSPLISPLGKLRMGLDLFIPAKRDREDETLADFIRRRLGSEALDKIAEPLMSGIYNAEAERQSLLATFPRFRALEEQYGSLTRGMLAARRARANGDAAHGKGVAMPHGGVPHGDVPHGDVPHGDVPQSAFLTLQGGSQELVEALASRLTGDLRLNTGVQGLAPVDGGGYRLTLADGASLTVDAVVLATPAFAAAELLQDLLPRIAADLAAIRYVSTGTISLAFRRADVSDRLDGFGLVVPRSERRPINAITLSSIKFDHRAPKDCLLLRVFFGGSRSPTSMALGDAALLATVRGELRDLMGITARPLFHRIYRWQRSNPQYDVGHLARVAAIEAALPAGIYVTGSPYRGVGLPDCVKQGQETARRVLEAANGLG